MTDQQTRLDALTDILNSWQDLHGLSPCCALEQLHDPDITREQQQWIAAFVIIWDSVSEANITNRAQ